MMKVPSVLMMLLADSSDRAARYYLRGKGLESDDEEYLRMRQIPHSQRFLSALFPA